MCRGGCLPIRGLPVGWGGAGPSCPIPGTIRRKSCQVSSLTGRPLDQMVPVFHTARLLGVPVLASLCGGSCRVVGVD